MNPGQDNLPPKLATRLLTWLLRSDLVEEVLGDLEEKYLSDLSEKSTTKAKLNYWYQVMNYCRPFAIRKSRLYSNQLGMFKNYITISLRVFKKEKTFTGINILGLSVALALALLILLYVQYELSYEKHYPKSDRLVRLTMDYMDGETVVDQDCETNPPLGKGITEFTPEVENYTRVYPTEWITRAQIGDKFFELNKAYAVDPQFFELFDYPFVRGNQSTAFRNPREVVMTKSAAMRYFGSHDIIGEVVQISNREAKSNPYKVVGLINDSKPNTHLKIEVLFSYESLLVDHGEKEDNWGGNNTLTYLLLRESASYADFKLKLAEYDKQLKETKKLKNARTISQPIEDIHLYSHKSFETEPNGDAKSVYALMAVAILVILIALANYVNLATSKAMGRAKEVGVRKVIGSTRGQLRTQFFFETGLINLFAVALAILLITLFQNQFKHLSGLPQHFAPLLNSTLWLASLVYWVVATVMAGAYPAGVLSSFGITAMTNRKFSLSIGGSRLRRALVVAQFAITIILLVMTLTVREQLYYMKEKDLGVDVDRTLVVRAPSNGHENERFLTFKNGLASNPNIENISVSECVPGLPSGEMSTTSNLNPVDAVEKHSYNFYIQAVDTAFIPLMNLKLIAGENFTGGAQDSIHLVVTEEATRLWGYSSPREAVGKVLNYHGWNPKIIGVINNYNQESAKSAYLPIILRHSAGFEVYASIKFNGMDVASRVNEIEQAYLEAYPNRPFSFFFLDQTYDAQFRSDEQFRVVFEILTGFAILIACLGLFGLASYLVVKKTKEIGIRKVVGASMSQIVFLLSREFVRVILISIAIAVPAAIYLANTWLESFAFRIELGWWLIAIPPLLVLILAFLSVAAKTVKVANENPVNSLRSD